MARRTPTLIRPFCGPLGVAASAILILAVPSWGQPYFSPTPRDTGADEPMLVPPPDVAAG